MKVRIANNKNIPYEGHENIAFTSYDIENLPF